MKFERKYGAVGIGSTVISVSASDYELAGWATRPGSSWPCSKLACLNRIVVSFDLSGDLIDVEGDEGDSVPADELTAWSDDVLWECHEQLPAGICERVQARLVNAGIIEGVWS